MPLVRKTKRRKSVTRRAKIIGAVCAALALVLAFSGLYLKQQETRAQAAAEAASYVPAEVKLAEKDPVAAFLGDSFTAGAGASQPGNRWTKRVSDAQGWVEANFGYGGTNYATAGELEGGTPYTERVEVIVDRQPSTVIVSSAGNTMEVDQSEAVRQTFQALRAGLPDARIIATSPYIRSGDYPEYLTEFGEVIKAEVEAVGGEYMDIGHPLGNYPEAMAEDGSHPNDAGHQLIADAVLNKLR